MKITLFLIGVLSTLFSAAQIEDNLELKKIHVNFERDHSSRRIDRRMVNERDSIRQIRVIEILDVSESPTSNDYANAASVFSGCRDSISEVKVIELMTKSIELDPTRDKSLLAYGVDSQLIRQDKLQIYGTQSYISLYEETFGQIVMYEVDTTQVSDSQRIEYGVRTLAEQKEYNKLKSQKPLSDLMESGKSVLEVVKFCKKEFRENPASKYVSEQELYKFGLQLSRGGELNQALMVFELVAELYPNSFNAYDMLGDIYFKLEQYEKGIAAYERSLALNPHKKYALKKIEEQKNK